MDRQDSAHQQKEPLGRILWGLLHDLGFRAQGLGFRVQGLGFRVRICWGSGYSTETA